MPNEHARQPDLFAIQKGADLNVAECKTLREFFRHAARQRTDEKLIRGGASDTVFLVDTSLEKGRWMH